MGDNKDDVSVGVFVHLWRMFVYVDYRAYEVMRASGRWPFLLKSGSCWIGSAGFAYRGKYVYVKWK